MLLKDHVRELHELPPALQSALFGEVMAATSALVGTFRPWKMNHACCGNAEAHVHRHLFPRYDIPPNVEDGDADLKWVKGTIQTMKH